MSKSDDVKALETRVFQTLDAFTQGDISLWPELFAQDGVQAFPNAP